MQKHNNLRSVKFQNTARISILLFVVLALAAITSAQTPKADYQFQGNLNSSVAGAPAMTNLTGSGGANTFVADTIDGYARQSLRFPFNSGVAVNISGVIPNNAYTIVGLFRFDQVSGRRRVAGSDATDNSGAYTVDGRLEFESTTNPAFFPNTYIQIVVVREANGNVRAYRDGILRVTASDVDGDFIISTDILRMFQDDTNTPTEASAGNVARIRLYDVPLTTTQVRLLDREPNVGGGDQPILFDTLRDGFREIYTMNADGSNQRRLTFNEVTELGAKWSPDKTKIVYFRAESGTAYQIWIMNADGSGQTRLTNTSTINLYPSWKPDGSKILFSRCTTAGVCDLFTMNPDGSNQAALPSPANTVGDEYNAGYSPDGTKIVFTCGTNTFTNYNICIANADGSNRQQLTNTVSPVLNDYPLYSPNSAKIAFQRQTDSANSFTSDIFTMDSNGNNQINLTNTSAIFDQYPVWSPDGTRLAFASQRESVFTELYTMNSVNGGAVTRLTVNSVGEGISDWYRPAAVVRRTPFDFDGDGKADIAVFRPSNSAWYLQQSTAGFTGISFGQNGDKIVPADYDGDGKTDIAVYRAGFWYLQRSTAGFTGVQFGIPTDIPVPADFDGDGKSEIAVFRPSNGAWYIFNLVNNQFTAMQFGQNDDKPVAADFDGDGKADIAVFRPSNSAWYINRSQLGFTGIAFGIPTDIPVAADYDGDGKTDVAVFRPSIGTWYLLQSTAGFTGIQFGISTDLPSAADYDGDGKTDVAVFRDGTWYLQRSTTGFTGVAFGTNGDKPIPNAFVP